jgi:hypothetical protein
MLSVALGIGIALMTCVWTAMRLDIAAQRGQIAWDTLFFVPTLFAIAARMVFRSGPMVSVLAAGAALVLTGGLILGSTLRNRPENSENE